MCKMSLVKIQRKASIRSANKPPALQMHPSKNATRHETRKSTREGAAEQQQQTTTALPLEAGVLPGQPLPHRPTAKPSNIDVVLPPQPLLGSWHVHAGDAACMAPSGYLEKEKRREQRTKWTGTESTAATSNATDHDIQFETLLTHRQSLVVTGQRSSWKRPKAPAFSPSSD